MLALVSRGQDYSTDQERWRKKEKADDSLRTWIQEALISKAKSDLPEGRALC